MSFQFLAGVPWAHESWPAPLENPGYATVPPWADTGLILPGEGTQ